MSEHVHKEAFDNTTFAVCACGKVNYDPSGIIDKRGWIDPPPNAVTAAALARLDPGAVTVDDGYGGTVTVAFIPSSEGATR